MTSEAGRRSMDCFSSRPRMSSVFPSSYADLADDGTVIADITLDTLRAIRAA